MKNCCNGDGWYTSWNGGFSHPMPCGYCNREGRSAGEQTKPRRPILSIPFKSVKTMPPETLEAHRLARLVEARRRVADEVGEG